MRKERSYSFDDSSTPEGLKESEEDSLERELFSKIADRKIRESKEGFIHILESSWLSYCCGIFASQWIQRYAKLNPDRLSLSLFPDSSEISYYPLKYSSIKISELAGHNNKHNCIVLQKKEQEFLISLNNTDDLKDWMVAITAVIENLNKESSYFNF